MNRTLILLACLLLVGCSSGAKSSSVPRLSGATSSYAGPTGAARVSALHAAAQCIRQHGVPTYQDPVLTADGHVFTDARSIQDAAGDDRNFDATLRRACGQLVVTAGLQPEDEAPAPPALVQAGVKAAQCLRANGLPNYRDPTSSSPFTPGHGFGISGDELPNNGANGKTDPTFQRATTACRTQLDEEIRQSTLEVLAHD